jgi:hypothetical protein
MERIHVMKILADGDITDTCEAMIAAGISVTLR